MADQIFGQHPSDLDLPFAEAHGQGAPGLVVANASGANIGAGSFTMPWDGSLTAAFTIVYSWQSNAHQHAVAHLAASSPVPATFSQFNHIGLSRAAVMRGQIPMYARWNDLVKNQVVNLGIYCGVGGGGWNVTFEWWAGNVRAWPKGPTDTLP